MHSVTVHASGRQNANYEQMTDRPLLHWQHSSWSLAPISPAASDEFKRLTAREVIARIQQQVGVPWQSDTVDTFKAGDPDIPVTGIAVTMMAPSTCFNAPLPPATI